MTRKRLIQAEILSPGFSSHRFPERGISACFDEKPSKNAGPPTSYLPVVIMHNVKPSGGVFFFRKRNGSSQRQTTPKTEFLHKKKKISTQDLGLGNGIEPKKNPPRTQFNRAPHPQRPQKTQTELAHLSPPKILAREFCLWGVPMQTLFFRPPPKTSPRIRFPPPPSPGPTQSKFFGLLQPPPLPTKEGLPSGTCWAI